MAGTLQRRSPSPQEERKMCFSPESTPLTLHGGIFAVKPESPRHPSCCVRWTERFQVGIFPETREKDLSLLVASLRSLHPAQPAQPLLGEGQPNRFGNQPCRLRGPPEFSSQGVFTRLPGDSAPASLGALGERGWEQAGGFWELRRERKEGGMPEALSWLGLEGRTYPTLGSR